MSEFTAAPAGVPIRLLIVDDQPLIRRGLAMMLDTEPDVEVVGQAADGAQALEQALATRPDVVVMDLRMPVVSGVIATREITSRLPGTRVVVLTTYDHDDLVFDAISAGAHAYLLKDANETEVLATIRAVHRGESRLSPPIARKVIERFRALDAAGRQATRADATGPAGEPAGAFRADPSRADPSHGDPSRGDPSRGDPSRGDPSRGAAPPHEEPLTDKEQRVLNLLAEGLSNRQIAAAVFLAEGTVKNYVSRIMDKLHARTRTELAVRAVARRH